MPRFNNHGRVPHVKVVLRRPVRFNEHWRSLRAKTEPDADTAAVRHIFARSSFAHLSAYRLDDFDRFPNPGYPRQDLIHREFMQARGDAAARVGSNDDVIVEVERRASSRLNAKVGRYAAKYDGVAAAAAKLEI